MGDVCNYTSGTNCGAAHDGPRPFEQAALPSPQERFAIARDGESSGQLPVAEARAGVTKAGLVAGVRWRFDRESSRVSLVPVPLPLRPVVVRPTCSPIRGPRADYKGSSPPRRTVSGLCAGKVTFTKKSLRLAKLALICRRPEFERVFFASRFEEGTGLRTCANDS